MDTLTNLDRLKALRIIAAHTEIVEVEDSIEPYYGDVDSGVFDNKSSLLDLIKRLTRDFKDSELKRYLDGDVSSISDSYKGTSKYVSSLKTLLDRLISELSEMESFELYGNRDPQRDFSPGSRVNLSTVGALRRYVASLEDKDDSAVLLSQVIDHTGTAFNVGLDGIVPRDGKAAFLQMSHPDMLVSSASEVSETLDQATMNKALDALKKLANSSF